MFNQTVANCHEHLSCTSEHSKNLSSSSEMSSSLNNLVKIPIKAPECEESEEQDEYVVEKILAQRKRKKKYEYLIKWKYWPESDSSWEPEENLLCPDILNDFLQERINKQRERWRNKGRKSRKGKNRNLNAKKRKTDNCKQNKTKDKKSNFQIAKIFDKVSVRVDFDEEMADDDDDDDEDCVTGFNRGLQPERIFGALKLNNIVMFLMKWKDSVELDLVKAEEANLKCPSIVIKFYEKRLEWMPKARKMVLAM